MISSKAAADGGLEFPWGAVSAMGDDSANNDSRSRNRKLP